MSKMKDAALEEQSKDAEATPEVVYEDIQEESAPMVIPQGSVTVDRELPPAMVMAAAKEKAQVLIDAVKQAGLAFDLGGKKPHLGIEAWQLLGKFDNATPRLVGTKRIMENDVFHGYLAKCEVVKNGQVITSADAMCTRDEPNWNKRGANLVPEFQLRSMAQTRAASKALRMAYGWIAVLAGYSATPVEEMTGEEYKGKDDDRPAFMKQSKSAQVQAAQDPNPKMCPKCGAVMKLVPAGVSKKSGKSYSAFYSCGNCKATLKA